MTPTSDEPNRNADRTEGTEPVPPRPDSAPPAPPVPSTEPDSQPLVSEEQPLVSEKEPPVDGNQPAEASSGQPLAYGNQPPAYGSQQYTSQTYGSQPHGPAGSNPHPVAGYPQAGRPSAQGPFGALAQAVTWRTALVPAGIALLAGIVVSIILAALLTSLGDLSSLSEDFGMSGGSIGYALPFVLLSLALGGSGVVRMNASYEGAVGLDGEVHIVGAPLLISIVTLGLLWWLTKRSEARAPSHRRAATWLRIGITTLSFTLVLFLLQLIFAARMSISEFGGTAALEFSAVTARSFFLPLLIILVTTVWGRVAGHFKGTEAIGAPFLRWTVPAGHVALVHAALVIVVFSVIALVALPLAGDVPWKVIPLLFVNAGVILTSIVHLGGISASAMGALASYTDSASADLTLFSTETPGYLWLGLLVVVVAVLLSTLVSTVTRRPHWTVLGEDRQQWASMWRTPLAFLILWGVISMLVIPVRLSVKGSGELLDEFTGTGALGVGIGALPWSFLLFAVWGGVVEVLSRTLGPRLVMSLPGLAKLLAGRAIHPYWGQALGMAEPRGALIHPDVAAEMATQAHGGTTAQGLTPPGAPAVAGGPPPPPAYGSGPLPPAYGSVPPPPPGNAPPGSVPPAGAYGSAPPPPTAPGSVPPAGTYGSAPAPAVFGSAPPPPAHPHAGPGGAAWQSPQGAATAAYGSPAAFGAQTATAPPVQPFDKKKATIVGVVAGALAVVLVGGLIVVSQLNGRMFGPEAVAHKYFSALSDGDAEAALRLADVDVPAESRTLLTNEVLGAAAALPQDVVVEDSQVHDGTATVDVSFDVGGSKNSVTLSMRKAGKKALFFDDWALQSPDLAHLVVGAPGLDTVKVNGSDIPTGPAGVDLPAFPALYTVGLAEESEFVEAAEVTSRVFFTGAETDESMVLDAQPTDAFRSEVESQVKTLIDTCATKTDVEPDGCPFASSSTSYRDDVRDIVWSIEEYPTVTVTTGDYYDEGDSPSAWYVTTDSWGEALVTGTYLDWFDDRETFDESVTFWIEGTVEIIDGKVVVNVDPADSGY